jgi:hypothetical protein
MKKEDSRQNTEDSMKEQQEAEYRRQNTEDRMKEDETRRRRTAGFLQLLTTDH